MIKFTPLVFIWKSYFDVTIKPFLISLFFFRSGVISLLLNGLVYFSPSPISVYMKYIEFFFFTAQTEWMSERRSKRKLDDLRHWKGSGKFLVVRITLKPLSKFIVCIGMVTMKSFFNLIKLHSISLTNRNNKKLEKMMNEKWKTLTYTWILHWNWVEKEKLFMKCFVEGFYK